MSEKPVHLTDEVVEAGINYCEAQLNHNKNLDDERRAHFERELELLRGILEEQMGGIIRLL